MGTPAVVAQSGHARHRPCALLNGRLHRTTCREGQTTPLDNLASQLVVGVVHERDAPLLVDTFERSVRQGLK